MSTTLNDFDTSHLDHGATRQTASRIVTFLQEALGREPTGGGCRAFYSPEEWRSRGERYGCESVLVLCHDGGDLAAFCNYDYCAYDSIEAFRGYLETLGLYVEPCTSWYSAIYPI